MVRITSSSEAHLGWMLSSPRITGQEYFDLLTQAASKHGRFPSLVSDE
jgi:hypothetical protein